jgi:hypothetical protein
MDNPWRNLSREQPFVLEGDKSRILLFNNKVKDEHKIHLELLPEPYLGNPESEIVLLNLNPGFSIDDFKFHHFEVQVHRSPAALSALQLFSRSESDDRGALIVIMRSRAMAESSS